MPTLEARLLITAEDRASRALDAIEKRIGKMGAQFKALNRLAGDAATGTSRTSGASVFGRLEKTQARLASSIEKMTHAVDKLDRSRPSIGSGGGTGRSSSGHSGGGFSGLHAIGLGAGFEAAEVAMEVKRASFDRAHEEVRMALSGMSASEIERNKLDAAKLAADMPAVGMTEIMHEARNARAVVGSSVEAAPLMADLIRLRVIAQAQKPDQDVTSEMDQLVKGLEIKGVTQDPAKFREYMNGIAKGLSVFGDTLSASQFYQMFLYGRQATPRLSEQFMLSTAPTLAQELKGSSYGRAVSAFNRAIVSGRMSASAAKELQQLGLIGQGDLDKKGALKQGKSVDGWALAQTDPNAWVRQYLLPALDAHGIKDTAGISKAISDVFSNQLAAQMVSILATQQAKIDKDTGLLRGARGLEGADFALRQDPELAFHALHESLTNLAGTLGEGFSRAMAPIAADFAKAIARFSAKVEENNAWHKANGYDQDSPQTKSTRRVFNKLLFGVDSDKAISDVSPDERFEAEAAAKRRALQDQIRNSRITDPAKLAEIAERRKHVVPGFEASSKMMDDMDEFPGRYGAQQQLAELDAQLAAYRKFRAEKLAELDRIKGALRFANKPAPDQPTSPYIYGGDTPMEGGIGPAVFPTTKGMPYGHADITSLHAPTAPVAPASPPPPVSVSIQGSLKADPLVVELRDSPGVVATQKGLIGLRAEFEALKKSIDPTRASVGTSMPAAGPGGRTGRGQL